MSNLKGGNFLAVDTDPKDIFITEDFSEEQIMIGDMVQEFCIKEIQEPQVKRGKEFTATEDIEKIIELLEKSAELGLCGVAIGEEHGGMDLDFNTGLVFSEKIAHGLSFATTIGAQTSIGSLPIVYYGTKAQKDKYLPGVAAATIKASYCLTEPTAGSDANSGKTKAVLNKEGTHYMVNGQKMWITNGGFADLFIVFAKIDDDEDLSAFIIEKAFGGVTIGAEEKKLGIKGSSTVQVFFTDCPVPKENLLGERQGGFKMALNILNTGRIKLAAGTNGGCKFGITNAVEYAAERKQFDTPIIEFGAMQHKIGEMASRVFSVDAGVYRIGRNIDEKAEELKADGMDPSTAKLEAVREYAIECAILKVKGSENADFVVDEVLQIFGGMGYSQEAGVEMAYRDSRITRIYEGTNEINRLLSMAELTKRAIKTKEIDLIGAGKQIPGRILSAIFRFGSGSGIPEAERVVRAIKDVFLMISGDAGKRLGKKMVDEQEIVMNLADMMADAFICESVLLKIKKLQSVSKDPKKLEIQTKMMEVYLYEALERTRKFANDALASYPNSKSRNSFIVRKLLGTYNINAKEHRRDISNYLREKKGYCF